MTHLEAEVSAVRNLEHMRYQAIMDADWDSFEALCHPDLVYTHASGHTDSLDSYLKKVRAGFFVYHHIEHPVDVIRIVGDTALVVGEMNGRVTAGGVEKMLRNRSLAVWTRTAQGWRLVAYQPTPIQA